MTDISSWTSLLILAGILWVFRCSKKSAWMMIWSFVFRFYESLGWLKMQDIRMADQFAGMEMQDI